MKLIGPTPNLTQKWCEIVSKSGNQLTKIQLAIIWSIPLEKIMQELPRNMHEPRCDTTSIPLPFGYSAMHPYVAITEPPR